MQNKIVFCSDQIGNGKLSKLFSSFLLHSKVLQLYSLKWDCPDGVIFWFFKKGENLFIF